MSKERIEADTVFNRIKNLHNQLRRLHESHSDIITYAYQELRRSIKCVIFNQIRRVESDSNKETETESIPDYNLWNF